MSEQADWLTSEVERERLEIYLDDRRGLSGWWLLALGIVAGLTVATFDLRVWWVTLIAVVLLAAALGATMAVIRDRAGFSPRIAALPAPLKTEIRRYVLISVIVVVVGYSAIFLFPESPVRFTVAGVSVFVAVGILGPWFRNRYRTQARRLAEEAGISRG